VNFVRSQLSSAERRINFRTPLSIRVKGSLLPTNGYVLVVRNHLTLAPIFSIHPDISAHFRLYLIIWFHLASKRRDHTFKRRILTLADENRVKPSFSPGETSLWPTPLRTKDTFERRNITFWRRQTQNFYRLAHFIARIYMM
jgi:hypothetical protein